MKIFKFINKKHGTTNVIFIIAYVIIGYLIFSGVKSNYFNTHVAFLIVAILSFISVIRSVRKASLEFSEILIDDNVAKLYYFKVTKKPSVVKIKDIRIKLNDIKVELFNKTSDILIGRAYKNKIEDTDKWNELIKCFSNIE